MLVSFSVVMVLIPALCAFSRRATICAPPHPTPRLQRRRPARMSTKRRCTRGSRSTALTLTWPVAESMARMEQSAEPESSSEPSPTNLTARQDSRCAWNECTLRVASDVYSNTCGRG
jgi:hypothetical protein